VDCARVAEPSVGLVRGFLARMSMEYGAGIKLLLETVWEWHIDNLPESWEIMRARRIAIDTELRNRRISGE